ncbi:probable fructose-2,6-bisphosphatase TIGAR A [Gadus chalcogrammus]|uniref:probable fructose-2,6-bisphosphatase TIGAR A n=1 Tax=Gadus chalcogrammus TaxID=1042646 RepID=UPI0024C4D50F|nr:probable fructose-2,6-bisphosphatase TIGAR A [Gadus chalcogrammus]
MALFTMAFTLVRHGETQFNKDGLLQGQAIDSCLSETGVQQAEAAGRYLRDVTFTNVFVSSMLRARQTAEVILKHNSSGAGLEMVCDALLKEKSFGVAEGRPVEAYRAMAAEAGETTVDFVAPGGESEQQVTERFRVFLESMLRRIDADHWLNRPEPVPSTSEPLVSPPAEGRADEGLGALGAPGVHALLVGHGAYIRSAVRHLLQALGCLPPPGVDHAHMLSLSPNTGLSRFVLTLARDQGGLAIRGVRGVFVHRADHLK